MKTLGYLALVVFLAGSFASCAPSNPTPTAGAMINPGDRIGDFLITTGGLEGVKNVWDLGCRENEGGWSCEVPVGAKVNVSVGIYPDPAEGGDLETKWAGLTYDLVIGGRPVNLEAFGPVEFDHPYRHIIRCWDVVVTADKPGEMKYKETFALAGETQESDVTTLRFTAP